MGIVLNVTCNIKVAQIDVASANKHVFELMNVISGGAVVSTVALHKQGRQFDFWASDFLLRVCMLSLRMCRFSPVSPASSLS